MMVSCDKTCKIQQNMSYRCEFLRKREKLSREGERKIIKREREKIVERERERKLSRER